MLLSRRSRNQNTDATTNNNKITHIVCWILEWKGTIIQEQTNINV